MQRLIKMKDIVFFKQDQRNSFATGYIGLLRMGSNIFMCVRMNLSNLHTSFLTHPALLVRHLAKCMRCCNALRGWNFSFQSTSVLYRTLLMNNPAAVVFTTVTTSLFARDLLPLRSRLHSTLSQLFVALFCKLRQITIQCLICCLSVGENRRELWNLQRANNLNLAMRVQLEKCYFIKNCCNTKKGG